MTASLPWPLIRKEGRALAPIWLAAVVSIVASRRIGMPLGGVAAFVLGAVALGVFSIGHEYAHRTLTSLLAQPLSRTRLLLSKVVVLAPLLALLTWVAARTLLPGPALQALLGKGVAALPDQEVAAQWRLWILVLTPVLGLCIAPWMTMVCRSAMGGLVFTLAVPAALWTGGQIARVATVGFMVDPLAYSPALTLMIAGLLAGSVVAVVHGRSMFVRLEALDAPRDITPSLMKRSTREDSDWAASDVRVQPDRSGRRHPLVMLAQKEVRLHALAFAVAALYALVWIAMRLTRTDAYIAGQSFEAASALYGMFLAMLLGATASAEERALGTAEWQMLQPWAYWKQWTVKVMIVCVLTLILGLAVPIVLEAAFPLIGDTGHAGLLRLFSVINYWGPADYGPLAILLIALFSFYISTLCAGGLRALLLTLPLSFGLASLYADLVYATYRVEQKLLINLYGPSAFDYDKGGPWWRGLTTATGADWGIALAAERWISLIVLGGFIGLIFAFALRNSKSAERGTTIARRQLPWVLTYVVLAAVISRAAPAYLGWWLLTH